MTVSVKTQFGEIIGTQGEGITEFKGIPYAEQPIGVARFKAPEPLIPFDEPFLANKFGDAAPQEPNPMFGISETSEDCLYLNIWSPGCDQKKRPVMIWLHGGAFILGSSSQDMYNGRELAINGEVVVVSINYRLGVLGYLYLNELLPENFNVSANNGLLDQIEALKWIKNNIAAFGGDPDNITLFGESAGAMSIATLMACPRAEGLFHRAILQSGAADQVVSRDDATRIAKVFLDTAGVDQDKPEKLWDLTPDQILKAQRACLIQSYDRGAFAQPVPQKYMTLVPVVDGDIVPQHPMTALKNGAFKDFPMMVGCTAEEWNLFARMPGASQMLTTDAEGNPTKESVIKACEISLPGMGERAVTHYEKVLRGCKKSFNCMDVLSAFETDRVFRIPTLRIAEFQSQYSQQMYVFQFDWDKGMLGACHASDIPFVFGNTADPAGQLFTGGGDAAARLSTLVQNCWIAFARSGDPSTDGVGKWKPFNTDTRQVMCFDEQSRLVFDPFEPSMPLWEGVL